jgi:hypothetical protein
MKCPAIIVLALVCLFGLSKSAGASNLVTNGSFESTSLSSPGGYFCQAGATCVSNVTGWTSVCNHSACGNGNTVLSLLFAGTNGSAFNGNIGLWGSIADSPDGGNFVGADGDSTYGAPLSQTINGLITGDTYTLSFYQAAAQQNGSDGPTTERWQVTLGGDTQLSALMTNTSHGFQAWNQQTMTFQATSTSELLTFLAVGTPSGVPPVSLLDGVSLLSTTAPEPGPIYVTALGLGLLGLTAIRRQRKRTF